jgi:predicted aspartyl protease
MHRIATSLALLGVLTGITALPALAAECGPLQVMAALPMRPIAGIIPGVDVTIGDTRETLIVDTGASLSLLRKRTIRELNLAPTQSNVVLKNVSGQTSNQAVRLPSITLGRLRQEGAYFWVHPSDEDAPYAGSIGTDVLQKFDVDFDFGMMVLNLISPNHCDGKIVYWSAPAIAVVPMRSGPYGEINFVMQLDGKRVNVNLDTGTSVTTMNLEVARRVFGIDTSASDVEKIGELDGNYKANVYKRRFKTLSVDGVTVSNPIIQLLPDMMTPRTRLPTGSLIRDDPRGLPELLLGMSTLQTLHLYIAYNERKIYITAAGPSSAAAVQPEPTPQ